MSTRVVTLIVADGGYSAIVEGDRFIGALCADEMLAAVAHLLVTGKVPYGGLLTEDERVARQMLVGHPVHESDLHPIDHGGQHPRLSDPARIEARLKQLNPEKKE